jgi:hypothetical protein
MRLARAAYCSVERLSSKLMSAGEIAAIMIVFALPPAMHQVVFLGHIDFF